jgi:hypothetical protein
VVVTAAGSVVQHYLCKLLLLSACLIGEANEQEAADLLARVYFGRTLVVRLVLVVRVLSDQRRWLFIIVLIIIVVIPCNNDSITHSGLGPRYGTPGNGKSHYKADKVFTSSRIDVKRVRVRMRSQLN